MECKATEERGDYLMINLDNREQTATRSKNRFTPKLADVIRRNFRDPNTKVVIQVKNRIFFVGTRRVLRKTYEISKVEYLVTNFSTTDTSVLIECK